MPVLSRAQNRARLALQLAPAFLPVVLLSPEQSDGSCGPRFRIRRQRAEGVSHVKRCTSSSTHQSLISDFDVQHTADAEKLEEYVGRYEESTVHPGYQAWHSLVVSYSAKLCVLNFQLLPRESLNDDVVIETEDRRPFSHHRHDLSLGLEDNSGDAQDGTASRTRLLARVFASSTAQSTICDKWNPVPGVCPDAPSSHGYQGGVQDPTEEKGLWPGRRGGEESSEKYFRLPLLLCYNWSPANRGSTSLPDLKTWRKIALWSTLSSAAAVVLSSERRMEALSWAFARSTSFVPPSEYFRAASPAPADSYTERTNVAVGLVEEGTLFRRH
ncbi:hypothetical protein CONLIGDRAFT_720032 [Coniochaeta ligniaria NRRL 30616]|uniref:Uncharacterized protein n=1 Tax=Coniochaeta ligniaria NRRL 30616 TaxID=1408157 RepID=A0A1J7IZ93_9PEZI|nr:hypothetical protein CONLIGDRAFT_720032 [Coniochaeta ligniaria NRRL 30616]